MEALKIEAPPRGRTQGLVRRTVYQERGSPVRASVERTARISAAIVEILRKTVKYPPELEHCLNQDAE